MSAIEVRPPASRDRVVSLLETFGGEWTPASIARSLELKPNTTRHLVQRMVTYGELCTDDNGNYWVTPATIRRARNRQAPRRMSPLPMSPVVAEHVVHLRRRNLQESTIDKRRTVIGRLERWLAKEQATTLMQVTTAQLVMFTDFPNGVEGRRSVIGHVSGFYRWAHEHEGLIEANPAAKLVRPRPRGALPRPMPEDRLALLLGNSPEPVRTWFVLAAFCGLRAMEIAPMRRDDIDMQTRLLYVMGKGAKPRTLPMPPIVIETLRPYIRESRDWFFPKGGPGGLYYAGHITPSQLQKRANTLLRGMGIPDTLHSLRHRYATLVYEASGFDLLLTSTLLGHSSPSTTARYAKIRAQAHDVVALLPDAGSPC